MGGKNKPKNRVYYQEFNGLYGTFASLVNSNQNAEISGL